MPGNGTRKDSCQTLPMWAEFDELVHNFFYSKKLSDLIKKILIIKPIDKVGEWVYDLL